MQSFLTRETIKAKLCGRRLIFLGEDCAQKQSFMQNLAHLASQWENSFEIFDGEKDPGAGDYVFLFADAESGKALPSELLDDLRSLEGRPVTAAVLISDMTVYGCCFDEEQLRGTEELGYVCHTRESDIAAQNLRLAEHLVCKMAREEKIPLRIARAQGNLAGEELEEMILDALLVALEGNDGEIYNLPGRAGDRENPEHSPLAPKMPTVDTGKVELL